MVLTANEKNRAKASISSNSKLSSLLHLRETTTNFIIQCLADREIQCILRRKNDVPHELALLPTSGDPYNYNCGVVHNPVTFANVAAHKCCPGWNSKNSTLCKHPSPTIRNETVVNEKFNELKKRLMEKQKSNDDLRLKWENCVKQLKEYDNPKPCKHQCTSTRNEIIFKQKINELQKQLKEKQKCNNDLRVKLEQQRTKTKNKETVLKEKINELQKHLKEKQKSIDDVYVKWQNCIKQLNEYSKQGNPISSEHARTIIRNETEAREKINKLQKQLTEKQKSNNDLRVKWENCIKQLKASNESNQLSWAEISRLQNLLFLYEEKDRKFVWLERVIKQFAGTAMILSLLLGSCISKPQKIVASILILYVLVL